MAVTAVRGSPKTMLSERGGVNEPYRWNRFIVSGRVWPRPANDNAPIHGGYEALGLATGIVLTLVSCILVLQALS